MRLFLACLVTLFISFCAMAQPLTEAEVEQRAKQVGQSLRCVVCQNQTIEESDASLAQDMRKLVRARIRKGDSNEEVIAFMQNRYGDFVLLKPPVQANTYLLWFTPAVLLGFLLLWYGMRVGRSPVELEAEALNDDELKRLKTLADTAEDDR